MTANASGRDYVIEMLGRTLAERDHTIERLQRELAEARQAAE